MTYLNLFIRFLLSFIEIICEKNLYGEESVRICGDDSERNWESPARVTVMIKIKRFVPQRGIF